MKSELSLPHELDLLDLLGCEVFGDVVEHYEVENFLSHLLGDFLVDRDNHAALVRLSTLVQFKLGLHSALTLTLHERILILLLGLFRFML